MSLPGVGPIRDRRPFKRKAYFGYLGIASQDTVYNSRTRAIGKLHESGKSATSRSLGNRG